MRNIFTALSFGLLIRICAAAAPDYSPAGILLDQFIEREMGEKGINGAAIALVDDQKIVWSRGYGIAKPDKIPGAGEETLPTGPAMRENTPIRAGSVSK